MRFDSASRVGCSRFFLFYEGFPQSFPLLTKTSISQVSIYSMGQKRTAMLSTEFFLLDLFGEFISEKNQTCFLNLDFFNTLVFIQFIFIGKRSFWRAEYDFRLRLSDWFSTNKLKHQHFPERPLGRMKCIRCNVWTANFCNKARKFWLE